jgi:DNA-binding CsgD family transcriptional regulator
MVAGVVEELDRVADVCARLDFAVSETEVADRVLAPIAGLVRAETASWRCFGVANGRPVPLNIVSIAIPPSVREAYLERYFDLDPIRRVLARRLGEPVFADPSRRGRWSSERAAPASDEFRRYRREFLLPNDFYHHLGFCVQDSAGRVLALDFHRAQRARPFGPLEQARARVVAAFLHAHVGAKRRVAAPGATFEPRGGLSQREAEVAKAVVTGLSNKQVAESLGVSVRTVENHLRSIFAKCGVTTRTMLAARLVRGNGDQRLSD